MFGNETGSPDSETIQSFAQTGFVPTDAIISNRPLVIDQDVCWKGIDMIGFRHGRSPGCRHSQHHVKRPAACPYVSDDRLPLVVVVDRDHGQATVLELVVQGLKPRELLTAWATPVEPEVQKQGSSIPQAIGEISLSTIEPCGPKRRRGLADQDSSGVEIRSQTLGLLAFACSGQFVGEMEPNVPAGRISCEHLREHLRGLRVLPRPHKSLVLQLASVFIVSLSRHLERSARRPGRRENHR